MATTMRNWSTSEKDYNQIGAHLCAGGLLHVQMLLCSVCACLRMCQLQHTFKRNLHLLYSFSPVLSYYFLLTATLAKSLNKSRQTVPKH